MSLKQKWKWIYCDHRHWYNSYKIFQNIPTYLPSFISFWLTLVCSGCVFCPPAHLRIFMLEYMLHIYTVYTCTSTYMSTEVHLYSTLNFKLGMFHKLLSLNLLPPSGWNHFPRTSLFSKLHLSSFYYYTHTHTQQCQPWLPPAHQGTVMVYSKWLSLLHCPLLKADWCRSAVLVGYFHLYVMIHWPNGWRLHVCVYPILCVWEMMDPRKYGNADKAEGNVFIWLQGFPQRSQARDKEEVKEEQPSVSPSAISVPIPPHVCLLDCLVNHWDMFVFRHSHPNQRLY